MQNEHELLKRRERWERDCKEEFWGGEETVEGLLDWDKHAKEDDEWLDEEEGPDNSISKLWLRQSCGSDGKSYGPLVMKGVAFGDKGKVELLFDDKSKDVLAVVVVVANEAGHTFKKSVESAVVCFRSSSVIMRANWLMFW